MSASLYTLNPSLVPRPPPQLLSLFMLQIAIAVGMRLVRSKLGYYRLDVGTVMDAVSVIIHLSLLRSKTRSLGIMLDADKHTYVNVSNEQGPSPKQPNASQSAEKKPVPVPRSALLRADIL